MNAQPRPVQGQTNRHPVDELFDVREARKALEARKAELKELISARMGAADSLGGDECIAFQKVSTRKGEIDEAELKRLGVAVPRKTDVTVFSLTVERRASEAA